MHEPFYVDLAPAIAKKFGSENFLNVRTIIHHIKHCTLRGKQNLDFEFLKMKTKLDEFKIVEIVQWIQSQLSDEFEIEWIPS